MRVAAILPPPIPCPERRNRSQPRIKLACCFRGAGATRDGCRANAAAGESEPHRRPRHRTLPCRKRDPAGRRPTMRDTSFHRWHRWRITAVQVTPVADRHALLSQLRMPAPVPAEAPKRKCEEKPGPDGIRHELVARIRREIAAGTYDTEEKWLAAEAELLRRIEERI